MEKMLTYESVWLENDQFLKVKEFIEKLGITHYTTQRIDAEGVSTIAIPEISEEHWHLVEDFEYTLLRGDFEVETDHTVLQQLKNNLAKGIFGLTVTEARQQGICVSCKQRIYYSADGKAEKEGHIYSCAGQNEYRMSALCEYCCDKAFNAIIAPGEREIEELESFTENRQ